MPTSARSATTASSDGLVPACAKACPTASIQFGPIDELRERARERVEELHRRGVPGCAPVRRHRRRETYSELNSFYLLVDRPSVYGLPEEPFNPWLHMTGDYVAHGRSGGAGRARRAARCVPAGALRCGPTVDTRARPATRTESVTKAPDWHGLVAWDMLFNNLTTGLFLVAAVGELAAPAIFAPLATLAYPLALALAARRPGAAWSSTWATRCGSTTCCGSSSRARRCRWGPGA